MHRINFSINLQLQKSLPLLRQSLVMKELSIEGIKPPPHSVAFGTYTTSNIAAQVRPVVNLPAQGNFYLSTFCKKKCIGGLRLNF